MPIAMRYGQAGTRSEASEGSTTVYGEMKYVHYNYQLSSSTSSNYSSVLDVGEAGNTMYYGGSLFNRASTYTGRLALYGSNDNSSWTQIRYVERGSGGQTAFNGTDSSYRYYRLRLYNASSNNIACGVMMACVDTENPSS